MKTCSSCGEAKDFVFFAKHKRTKDGLQSQCKVCKNKQSKIYRENNKKKISLTKKKWAIKNRDYVLKQKREYYQKNKEIINKKNKQRYQQNKDAIAKMNKKYVEKNREKVNKRKRAWAKQKENNDPVFKTKKLLRSSIFKAFMRKGWSKNTRTQKVLGCDYKTAIAHLEKTFKDNYGIPVEDAKEELHIDHIVPLSTAKTEEELIKLNHYTNLQYLYASHNLQKNDSLDWKLEEE